MEIQYFLPSEISRLVLGYLREQNCLKTYQSFLKESPHLLEYISLLKAGHEYPTTIAGRNLVNMLQEYAALKLCSENKYSSHPVNALWRQFDSVVEHLKDRQVLSTRLWKGTTQTARTRCQIVDSSHERAARCKEISSYLKGREANVNSSMEISSIPTSEESANQRINSSSPIALSRLVPDSADSDHYRESIQAVVSRSQKNGSAVGEDIASPSVSCRTRARTTKCAGKLVQTSDRYDGSLNTLVMSVPPENADLGGLDNNPSASMIRDKVSDNKRDYCDKMDNVNVCGNNHLKDDTEVNCDNSGQIQDEEVDVELACDIPDIHDMSSPQRSSKIVIKSPLELQEKKDDVKEDKKKLFSDSVTNPKSLDINQGKCSSETSVCSQHREIDSQLKASDSSLQQKETGPKHFQAMSLLSSQTTSGPVQIPVETNIAAFSQTISAIENDVEKEKDSSTACVLVTPAKQHPNRIGSENFITPAKLVQSLTDAFQVGKSPRRKKPPKKRISLTNVSDKSATESATHNDSNSSIAGTSQEIIEKLLNDTTLHEKLAENINRGLTGLESKHCEAKSQVPKKKDISYYTASSTLDDLFDMQETQMADDAIQGIINLTKNDSTFDSLFKLFFDDKEDDSSPVENNCMRKEFHSSGEMTEKGAPAQSDDAEPVVFPSTSPSATDTQPFSPHAAPLSPACRGMVAQSPLVTCNNTLEASPGPHTPSAASNSDSPCKVESIVPNANAIFSPHTQANTNFSLNAEKIVGTSMTTPCSDLTTVNSPLINVGTSEPAQSNTTGMVMSSNQVTSSPYIQHPRNTANTVTPSRTQTSVAMESVFSTNGNYDVIHHGHLPYSPSVCQEVTLPNTPTGQVHLSHHVSSPFSPHMTEATARLAIDSNLKNSVPPVVTEVEVAYSTPMGPRLAPRQQIDSPIDSPQAMRLMGWNEACSTQQPGTYHSFIKEVLNNGNNSTPVTCISATTPVLQSHNVGNLILPITFPSGNGMGPLSFATSNLVPPKSSRQVTTASISSHPPLLSTATNIFGSTINLADAASILPESFPMPQPESHISTDTKDTQVRKKKGKGRRVQTEKTGKKKQSSVLHTTVASNVAASHQVVVMSSGSSNSAQTLSINASDVNIINHKLVILSPGGKSLIQIPIMDYEHSAELETVSGTVSSCQDNVQIWSENLESNTHLSVISTVASTITTVTTTTCGTTNQYVTNPPGKIALEYNSTKTTASGSFEGLLLPTYVPEVGDDEQSSQQETDSLENAEPGPKSCPETASDVLGNQTSPPERKSSLDSSEKLIAYPLGLLCTKKKGIHIRALDFGQCKISCVKTQHAKQEQSKSIRTDRNKFENQMSDIVKAKPSSEDSNIEGLPTDNCDNDPEVVERENEEVATNKWRDFKQGDKETVMFKFTGPATIMSKPKIITNSNLSPGELRMPGFGRGRRHPDNEEVVVGVGQLRRTLYNRDKKQAAKGTTTIDKKMFPKKSTTSKTKRVLPKRGAARTASPKSRRKKKGNSDRTAFEGVLPDANPAEHESKMASNSSSDSSALEICIEETEENAQYGKGKFNNRSIKNQTVMKKETKDTKKTHRRTSKGKSEEFPKKSYKSKESSKKKSARKSEQKECNNMSQNNSVGQDCKPSKLKRGSLFKRTIECSSAGKENDPSDSEKEITGQPLKEPKKIEQDEKSKTQKNCKTLSRKEKSKAKPRTSKPDSDKESTHLPISSSLGNSCKNWKVSLKSPTISRRNNKAGKSKDSINNRNRKKLNETTKTSSDTKDLQVQSDELCIRTVKHSSDKILKSKKLSENKNLHAESLVADFVPLKESEKKSKESTGITSQCHKELTVIRSPCVRIPRASSFADDKEENKVKRIDLETLRTMDGKENGEQLENIPSELENVMKGINGKETNQISEEEIENACRSISESPFPSQNDDRLSISSHVFHEVQRCKENNQSTHCSNDLSTSSPIKQTFESVKTFSTPNSSVSSSDETPRKCEVLEKLGLTPKKNEFEKPLELNSSQRPNVMDLFITQTSPFTKGSNPREMKKTPRKRASTPHKILTSPMTKLKSPLQSIHISPERNHSTISSGGQKECLPKENQQKPQNSQRKGQKRSFGEAIQQCDLQPLKKVKQSKKEKKPDVMSKLQSLDIDAFLSRVHNKGQSDGISSPCSS